MHSDIAAFESRKIAFPSLVPLAGDVDVRIAERSCCRRFIKSAAENTFGIQHICQAQKFRCRVFSELARAGIMYLRQQRSYQAQHVRLSYKTQ